MTRANRGLEYLQGSHRCGRVLTGESIHDGFDWPELEKMPDIDAERDRYTILSW